MILKQFWARALLGARKARRTDRGAVAALVEEGCRANGLGNARGATFEWEEAAARQLVAEELDGADMLDCSWQGFREPLPLIT